ncbi:MAG: MucR family transcriptional regulator [Geminicoccaceae bacterium]
MSIEEADTYLASDPIHCLLCGRTFRSLGRHLRYTHALETDAYRELYGLPYSVGLASPSTRKRFAEVMKARALATRPRRGRKASATRVFKPLELRGKERKSHYQRLRAMQRLNEVNGLPPGFQFGKEHLQTFVARVLTGRTFREVAKDPDMPSLPWVRIAFQHWPEVRESFETGVESLPFPVQAKLNRLGSRFAKAVLDLRARGLSIRVIAQMLGVTLMSVHARIAEDRKRQAAAAPPPVAATRKPPSTRPRHAVG